MKRFCSNFKKEDKMRKEIQIGPILIGPSYPPFLVAELSGNHKGSLQRALEIVEKAKQAGAHAVKLQTYTPDTITLNMKGGEFLIEDQANLWKNRNLYELYQEAYTPWEWHSTIFDYCRKLGIEVFSTPFDETAVDFLESLNPPCYKIASPEIVDHDLIRKVAQTGKPLILSTAAATLMEIGEAVAVARQSGCDQMILLKCTAAYPAQPKDIHLRTIPHLADSFDTLVGLSDHTLGIGVALASVALGACLIEKHFTLSRQDGGVDSAFSMEPHEFQALVEESQKAWEALGEIHYAPIQAERVTLSHRPSLYFVEDLAKGSILKPQHVRTVRPGKGLPPKELPHILGLTLTQNVKKGTPVSWEVFKANDAY
jgi:pseudaminic acid synthase